MKLIPCRLAGAALVAAVLASVLPGCGSPSDPPTSPYDAVVIVAGATRNTPAPVFNEHTAQVTSDVIASGGSVDVVRVSGTPTIVPREELNLRALGGTAAGNAAVLRRNLDQIEEVMAAGPTADHADYVESILVAADQVHSLGANDPVLLVIGSGMSDRGVADLTGPGMLGADGAEVVAAAASTGQLPANDRLDGITVLLSGTGWTAEPQEPLTDTQRATVTQILADVLTAMGAAVQVDPGPRSGDPVATEFVVDTVSVPPVGNGQGEDSPSDGPICEPQEIVYDQQSDVRFLPDATQFVDQARAAAAMDELVGWLLADPTRRATLRGTTADDGSPSAQLREFSLLRAQVVADYLVAAGVSPDRLTVEGVGIDFPEYIRPDRDAAGGLLPGPAALNRSVRVTLTTSC